MYLHAAVGWRDVGITDYYWPQAHGPWLRTLAFTCSGDEFFLFSAGLPVSTSFLLFSLPSLLLDRHIAFVWFQFPLNASLQGHEPRGYRLFDFGLDDTLRGNVPATELSCATSIPLADGLIVCTDSVQKSLVCDFIDRIGGGGG
jgi:hypothetical protein